MNEFTIPDVSSMSDTELEEHCKKFFPHTRPKKTMDFAIMNILGTKLNTMTAAQQKIAAELEKMKSKKISFRK